MEFRSIHLTFEFFVILVWMHSSLDAMLASRTFDLQSMYVKKTPRKSILSRNAYRTEPRGDKRVRFDIASPARGARNLSFANRIRNNIEASPSANSSVNLVLVSENTATHGTSNMQVSTPNCQSNSAIQNQPHIGHESKDIPLLNDLDEPVATNANIIMVNEAENPSNGIEEQRSANSSINAVIFSTPNGQEPITATRNDGDSGYQTFMSRMNVILKDLNI